MPLLQLLQLASPNLPVGAYSYSEGLETLVQQALIHDRLTLADWLRQELTCGAIRVDAAVMVRAYRAAQLQDEDSLHRWNQWLTATRETEELRSQSLQMGNSLLRLLQNLDPPTSPHSLSYRRSGGTSLPPHSPTPPSYRRSGGTSLPPHPQRDTPSGWNFAIAFALAADTWQISESDALLGYLQSWLSNLINAGIKLIPLGQTDGQRLLLELATTLEQAAQEIQHLPDEDLASWGWGLSIASMQHETLYSRLFRS